MTAVEISIMSYSIKHRQDEESSGASLHYDQMLLFRRNSRITARMSSADYTTTMVGSAASGVDISGSDQDMMIEPQNIIIEESSIIYREDLPCYVRIPTNELRGCGLVDGDDYMRADRVRDMSEEIFGGIFLFDGISKVGKTILGPENSIDIVPQLKISGLPSVAQSFTTRDRSWPSDDIVSIIKNGEFHLAARPAPSNPDPEHDFCLSFAKAEVVLTITMSVNQVLSIKMLKEIGGSIDGGRGVLTSYKMKTVALWFYEQTDNREWEYDRPVVGMLIRLHQYLMKQFLPHYFVHKMNLLSDVSRLDINLCRTRLWSFLGYYLIVEDITAISSYTKLILAFNMVRYAKDQFVHMFLINIGNKYACSGNVPDQSLKRQLSAMVIRLCCPMYITRRSYLCGIIQLCYSFNKLAGIWLKSHKIESPMSDEVSMFITSILGSRCSTDPLDIFFGMNSDENVCGSRIGEDGHKNSEVSMKKWLTFIDAIINRLISHGNNIADQVLDGMSHRSRDNSCVNSYMFMSDVCTLLDQVTKEIIEFSIDIIDGTPSPVDSGVQHSLRKAAVGDSPENIYMLYDAIEVLFLPIEYDIVRRIRGMASTQLFDAGTMEYRCIAAFSVAREMLRLFDDFQSVVHSYNGYMLFMANAIRGAREL